MTKDYPHIQFRRHWTLTEKTLVELGQCSAIIVAIANVPITPEQHAKLLSISLTKGARATTAIEGNTLTEEEVEAIQEGNSTLPPSKQYQEQEVRNILDAFNAIFDAVAIDGKEELLTPDLLRSFHRDIGKDLGEHFDAIPGKFREDQRIVGTYRCPDFRDVPQLIDHLCAWLEREFHFKHGQNFVEAVIEAIVSHVYIEWVHPFGDGNGRTGRLVEFYFLLRAGTPDIASHILSNHYNDTRAEYYRQLERAGKTRDLSDFISYAVQGLRDGLLKTLETVQRAQFETAWREYVYGTFKARRVQHREVFNRQRDLALAMPLNEWLPLNRLPFLTIELARLYAHLSPRTLLRDVDTLKEMGLVVQDDREQYRTNCDQLLNKKARRSQKRLLQIGESVQSISQSTNFGEHPNTT